MKHCQDQKAEDFPQLCRLYPLIGEGGIQLGRLQDSSVITDSTWPKAFPFEGKYAALRRTVDNQFGGSETLFDNSTPAKPVQPTNVGIWVAEATLCWPIREDLTVDQAFGTGDADAPMASAGKRLKIFFGFGDGPENLPKADTNRGSGVSGINFGNFYDKGSEVWPHERCLNISEPGL